MEDEDYQESLECSKCGKSVEQILALQCDHNLCLQCSAKQVQQQKNKLDSIKCEICEILTVLDPESSAVLQELRQEMQYKHQQQSLEHSANQKQRQFSLQQQTFNPARLDPHNQSLAGERKYINCREHPTEEAILYCYTCETPCICVTSPSPRALFPPPHFLDREASSLDIHLTLRGGRDQFHSQWW